MQGVVCKICTQILFQLKGSKNSVEKGEKRWSRGLLIALVTYHGILFPHPFTMFVVLLTY